MSPDTSAALKFLHPGFRPLSRDAHSFTTCLPCWVLHERGTCSRARSRQARFQPRHPPHPVRQLLRLPRPGHAEGQRRFTARLTRGRAQARQVRRARHRPGQAGEVSPRRTHQHEGGGRPHAPAGVAQDADHRAEGHAPPLGGRGRELLGALGVRAPAAPEHAANRQSHRRTLARAAEEGRAEILPRSRPPHTPAPRCPRPHWHSAHARRGGHLPR